MIVTLQPSGIVVQMDEGDLPVLDGYRWYERNGYIHGQRAVLLHRLILDPGPTELVDHRNGDKLDNRRTNLRIASKSTNAANSRQPRRVSPFRGVRVLRGRYFQANIKVRGERLYLGSFPSAEEAAYAYDDAARRYFGEFATLNFPEAS